MHQAIEVFTGDREKREAVRAAKRVAGVKAIGDDIEVQLPTSYHLRTQILPKPSSNKLTGVPVSPQDRFWQQSAMAG